MPTIYTKKFKVMGVSSNANDFGLRQMYLLAKDGEVWRVLANHLNVREKGYVVSARLNDDGKVDGFVELGYECPERCVNAPQKIVDGVWDDAASPSAELANAEKFCREGTL